jgi:hypothetical protein
MIEFELFRGVFELTMKKTEEKKKRGGNGERVLM